ncbi:MAG: hypothetical protein K2J83_07550 [Clostridia bacterium]|nr:hypothetical protein [Clostridia bacterium]
MKKLIITFAVFAVVFLFARLLFGYYVDVVDVFRVLLTPLTWLTVGFGVAAGVLIIVQIIKEFKKK